MTIASDVTNLPGCWHEEEGAAQYMVQLRPDGIHLADILEWVDLQKVELPAFRYRVTTKDVVLRLEFKELNDAAAFREAFRGYAWTGAPRKRR